MALTPFDPTGNTALWDPLSRMVGGSSLSLFDPRTMSEARAVANTRVDWLETPEAHIFHADLPGLRKDEVKVDVHDGRVLQISGERRKEEHQDTLTFHRVERTRGAFSRSFILPESAKIDEIQAKIDHGVLTVIVPKYEIGKPEPKRIDISG